MRSSRRDEARDYACADRALALRQRTGLTQRDLAALLGVSEKSVQAWEAGVSYPGADSLKQLIGFYQRPGLEDRPPVACLVERVVHGSLEGAAGVASLPASSAGGCRHRLNRDGHLICALAGTPPRYRSVFKVPADPAREPPGSMISDLFECNRCWSPAAHIAPPSLRRSSRHPASSQRDRAGSHDQ